MQRGFMQLQGSGLVLICALFFNGCAKKQEFWIYTSFYKDVVTQIEKELQPAFPDVKFQFFQNKSEVVATKVNAELAGGKTKADLLISSDPYWYGEMKKAGKLLQYASPLAKDLAPDLVMDPDHYFECQRIAVMVIGYNGEVFNEQNGPHAWPTSWKDLTSPKWAKQVSMGNPLDSGTNFTLVATLSEQFGWDYFKKLRDQGLISQGGSSAVINRMETRERPVGMVLFENILQAQARKSPVKTAFPTDGAIAIPSPMAIPADTDTPELAKKVYDWFFSEAAQKLIVRTGLYSPFPAIAPPEGAPKWTDLKRQLPKTATDREAIKKKFAEIVLR
jgi:iron(III) transport system substrate-binding protein